MSEVKTRNYLCHCGRVQWLEIQRYPSSNPGLGQKENLSQVQSEQYHHHSICTTVKCLKMLEVKTRNHCGTVVECSARDAEVPSSNPGVGKKKISHQRSLWHSSNPGVGKKENLSPVPIRTIPPPIPLHQTSTPEIVRGENQKSPSGTVVECRRRDQEVPSWNPGVGKKKISHRSNQNNTTTNPSAPELNT